jgi:thiamine biosynthesis lipoprotein
VKTERSAFVILVALAGCLTALTALTAIVILNQRPNVVSPRSALVVEIAGQAGPNSATPTAGLSRNARSAQWQQYSYSQLHMAMPMRITVWCDSESKAQSACKRAFRRASELVKVFSDYDSGSEIRRLSKQPVGRATPVSDDLLHVLEFSQRLSQRSSGAFAPTASPAIKLWRRARKNRSLPQPAEINGALERVGFENYKIDSAGRTVTLLAAKMEFDFGGIAKGYIGDQVIQTLRKNGIRIARYQAGGDIVLGDSPPETNGWIIGVGENNDGSAKTIQVANCGVSTSGDSQQFVEVEGQRYSHVIAPRTGVGLTSRKSAFVIALSGMQSDALATVGTILSDNDFQKLLAQYEGATGWTK